MDDVASLIGGFKVALSWYNLALMMVGILLGVIIGVLPGLGGANGVAILLPLTFTMPPTSAIIMLSCIYWGALFGGAITSILFNIPGEPWSVATTFDGHPMAQQGRADEALTAAFTSSFVGALVAVILITFLAPLIAKFALQFGPAEFFSVYFLTFASFVGMGRGSPFKVLASMCLGFALGAVGLDKVTGTLRMTFGQEQLLVGFDFLVAVIGLFGIGEILSSMESGLKFSGTHATIRLDAVLLTWKKLAQYWVTSIRSCIVGCWMGITPGGATPASFMSYGLAKRFSKRGNNFGKGEIEGVVAPETAAHAAGTSALLPMLTLGIPGSPTAAVLLGGLLIWGLQPGPMLFVEQKEFVWGLIASMYLGNIAGLHRRAHLRAAVRRHPARAVLDHRPRHPRDLRGRRLHGPQQHVRRVDDDGVRRHRLRVQQARLSAAAARARHRAGRQGRGIVPAGDARLPGQPGDLLVELAGGHDHDAGRDPAVLADRHLALGQAPVRQVGAHAGLGRGRRRRSADVEARNQSSKQNQEETMQPRSSIAASGAARLDAGAIAMCAAMLAGAAAMASPATSANAQAWEPTKPVQFIIPAGTGGGADQMARFIQGVVAKNNLMKQPLITVNKGGGAGAEGFLEVKKAAGDPHNIIITLSNLFTTPYATGVPFSWKDMTPVAMLALDQFVLWVNAETPYKTAKDYIDAVKAGDDKTFKMGGTGSKQEDQIITVALEKLTAPKKFTYVPYAGGGAVAVQLVGKHVNSTVNNPIEAVSQWKAGALRPLCLFDAKRSIYTQKVTADMAWSDIPTCKESGVDTEYQMLRGIFMAPGVKPEHVAFYVDLFKKVMATDDWKKFMEDGAFNQTFMTGDEFKTWVAANDKLHYDLMKEAGFLAAGK